MIIVDLILLVVTLIIVGVFMYELFMGDLDGTGCGFLIIIIILGLFLGCCSVPRYKKWSNDRESRYAHDQMMETSFKASPALNTTLNNLQVEIDKWKVSKEKFTRMRKAAQTTGGRSLANEKLARIDDVLKKLKYSRHKVLEQVEMIAMESAGQFTELDRKALNELSRKVEGSVRDARELREGFSGD